MGDCHSGIVRADDYFRFLARLILGHHAFALCNELFVVCLQMLFTGHSD